MKKTMLDKQNHSDNEDEFDVDEPSEEEPEELQNDASDDDWTPMNEPAGGRRTSGRTRVPKRTLDVDEESSEEISDADEDDEDYKGKKKNNKTPAKGRGAKGKAPAGRGSAKKPRATKKAKKEENEDDEEDENEEDESSSEESDAEDVPEGFRSGSFVVMKSDFKTGGSHPIWKIDGKSLLQKFVNMTDEDGDTCYKSTTIYAGWSKTSTSNYYPITVTTKRHQGKDHLVSFDKSQIKSDE